MAEKKHVVMTAEGLQKLKDELEYKQTTEKMKVAAQLDFARSLGDLSENAEYDAAKNDQAALEQRIMELRDMIENAEIVEKNEEDAPKDSVTLGSIVKVLDLEFDEEETYEIVGSQEANPKAGRISDDSPVGRALHTHRAGDTVTVAAPAGEVKLKILSVENK